MQVALARWHSAWGSLDHAQGWVWAGLVRGEFAKANMSIESVCHPGASPGAVASDLPMHNDRCRRYEGGGTCCHRGSEGSVGAWPSLT